MRKIVNYLLEEHRLLRPSDYLKAQILAGCITMITMATVLLVSREIFGVQLSPWLSALISLPVQTLVSFNVVVKGYKALKNRSKRPS